MPEENDFTRLALMTGEDPAPDADALIPELYDALRRIAASYLRSERVDHTLQPTALVHEAYARLVDQTRAPWADATHFRAIASRVMRQVLVDSARRHGAEKRGGGRLRVTLSEAGIPTPGHDLDMIELDEAMEALRTLDERKARVVELLYFGGLTHAEAAIVIGISPRTVESDWYLARAWLGRHLRGNDS